MTRGADHPTPDFAADLAPVAALATVLAGVDLLGAAYDRALAAAERVKAAGGPDLLGVMDCVEAVLPLADREEYGEYLRRALAMAEAVGYDAGAFQFWSHRIEHPEHSSGCYEDPPSFHAFAARFRRAHPVLFDGLDAACLVDEAARELDPERRESAQRWAADLRARSAEAIIAVARGRDRESA